MIDIKKENREVRAKPVSECPHVDVATIADYMGKCSATIISWINKGILEGEKIGQSYMIPRRAFDELKQKFPPPEVPQIEAHPEVHQKKERNMRTRIRTNQSKGIKKEEITIPVPVSLLSQVREAAKGNKLSLNLAVVQALETVYGQEETEQEQSTPSE